MPNRRIINLAAFVACAAMIGYALYSQHVNGLDPCPLCVFQRVAVIGLGLIFLLAALQNPARTGSRIYAWLLVLVAASGAAVSSRHVWLQSLPPDQVPACGPGLNYMLDVFPLRDALSMIFKGSGECAEIHWTLLGLSMPAWVLISLVLLGAGGFWNNWRKEF